MKNLADRLKAARKRSGLSQVELAKRAKVSPGTIGNLEAGTRDNPRELLAIASALAVNPEWLKSGKGAELVDAAASKSIDAFGSVHEQARAELLLFFDQMTVYDRAALLKIAHQKAVNALGDQLLAEKFGVTGYASDSSLPSVYTDLERRRMRREARDVPMVKSPLNLRGTEEAAGQDAKDDSGAPKEGGES